MSSVGWVFGVLKGYGVNTKGMSVEDAFEKLNELEPNKGKREKPEPKKVDREKQEEKLDALRRKVEGGSLSDAPKQKLVVGGKDAEKLYNDINSGKRFTNEELLRSPVVQMFERKVKQAESLTEKKPPISEDDKVKYGEKFLKGAEKTPKEFRADIVMGLPAAGKSSAVVNDLKAKYGSFEFDNDEIKKLLPGYDEYGASYVHNDSQAVQKYAFGAFNRGRELNGANLALPIIGSDVDKVDRWIRDLQNAGYKVHIHHVGISNEESMNRMVKRAIETGRYIPSHVIEGYGEKPKEVYEQLKKEGRQEVIFE